MTGHGRAIDGLFISYYEDIDRWHNDHAPSASGPTGSPAYRVSKKEAGKDTLLNRMGRQSVGIDGGNYDISRFLSHARFGSTVEYRRYDAFSTTHLSGAYYESLASRHGFEVLHANHVTRVDLEQLGQRLAPRFLFVSTTYMTETSMVIDVAQHVRRNWPGVPLIMGGLVLVELQKSVPAKVFQMLLKAWGADAYVITPLGEAAFLELLRSDGGRIDELTLPKAWVRRGAKYVVDESIEEPGLDIDENYVRWGLLDGQNLYHTVHTRTARSCAFICSFCSYFSNQGPLTLEQPETLERELEELAALGTVKSLIFTDDTFNVPVTRFKEILKVLSRFDFEWYSYYRAQFTDEDCALRMRDSGCKAVFLGIESLDDRVLKNMHKAATRKAYTRGTRELVKAGIATHANFIIGFPGDIPENTREAMRWIDGEGIDFFTVTPWYCSPATPIGQPEEKKRFGVVGSYWRWKHDTMNSDQALELEEWAIQNTEHSVFTSELAAQCFWSEIILYCNGFSPSQVQTLLRAFNRHAGRDNSPADLLRCREFQDTQRILRANDPPVPPGCDLFRTPSVAASLIGETLPA